MSDSDRAASLRSRRQLLAWLGGLGVTGAAGCGSGDGDRTTQPTTTRTSGTSTTTTPSQPPTSTTTEHATTSRPTTTIDMLSDRVWRMFVPPPGPGAVGFNPLEPDSFWFDGRNMMRADLFARSPVDLGIYPEAAKDWNYADGVLTVQLQEDLSWTTDAVGARNPVPVTADDWTVGTWLLGGLYRSDTAFERVEKVGEHRFRLYYETPRRREYAIDGWRLSNFTRGFNSAFWRPTIEAFQDAASPDERDRVLTAARDREVPTPNPVSNLSFRFSEAESDRWRLTLRDDEDPRPRWVDGLTFPTVEIVVRSELDARRRAFFESNQPFWGTGDLREGLEAFGVRDVPAANSSFQLGRPTPFATSRVSIPQRVTSGCLIPNPSRSPTENVHFRRALAYLLNRERASTRTMTGDRLLTGFTTSFDERRFISSDLLSTLQEAPHDNYGYDAVRTQPATAELNRGGFERDSQGRWLHQTGDEEGEPIVLEVLGYPQMERFADNLTAFENRLSDFGIGMTSRLLSPSELSKRTSARQFDVLLGHWGERLPLDVFRTLYHFVDGRVTGFPDRVTGPPVGEVATPPDEATDATETYRIRSMLSELPTADDATVRKHVDRLVWIYNQSVARLPVGREPWLYSLNTERWGWQIPTDTAPGVWSTFPHRKMWQRGAVRAIPGE